MEEVTYGTNLVGHNVYVTKVGSTYPNIFIEFSEQVGRLLEIGVPIPYGDPKLTDPQLSFQLAFGLPDLDFLHRLLRDRSETSRLKQVTSYLVHYIPKLQETGRMKKLAPLNGHSHRSPSL